MHDLMDNRNSGRMLGFGLVVLLHIALIYALANGLAQSVVEAVKGPIEVKILDTPPAKQDEAPPPPPPALDKPPPPFVPPPEVTIDIQPPPQTNAIAAVQSTAPTSNVVQPRPDPRNRKPAYPSSSRRMEEEGTVVLLIYVRADGSVGEVRIDKSSGYPKLDDSARTTAQNSWHFSPGMSGGSPTAMWFRFSVIFNVDD